MNDRPPFREALRDLINRYSKENGSDTPDFVLAEYLEASLGAFDAAVAHRTRWYAPSQPLEQPSQEPAP